MSDQSKYNKLKKVWYSRLKKDGFNDIEASEDRLISYSGVFAEPKSIWSWEAKQTYYQLATNFLVDNKFKSKLEHTIWEYHANGMSSREISKTLKKVNIDINRMTVWRTISKLQKKMKNKYLVGSK